MSATEFNSVYHYLPLSSSWSQACCTVHCQCTHTGIFMDVFTSKIVAKQDSLQTVDATVGHVCYVFLACCMLIAAVIGRADI